MFPKQKKGHTSWWSRIRVLTPSGQAIEHPLTDNGHLVIPIRSHRRAFHVDPNGIVHKVHQGVKPEPQQEPAPEPPKKLWMYLPGDEHLPEVPFPLDDWGMLFDDPTRWMNT